MSPRRRARGLFLGTPQEIRPVYLKPQRQPACARQLKRLAPSCAICRRIRPISTPSSWLAVSHPGCRRRSTWSARTRSVPRRSALASSVAQAAAVELLLLDPVQQREPLGEFLVHRIHRTPPLV